MDYFSIDEIMVFYEAVLVLKAKDLAAQTQMVRVANHAGKRTYKKYLKDLDNTRQNVEQALGKTRGTEAVFKSLNKLIGSGKR